MEYTNKTVSILGTEYKVEFRSEKEDKLLIDCFGYTDETDQVLVIQKIPENNEFVNPDWRIKKTLRHEIIHAFLFESGLWRNSGDVNAWSMNEEMVDWIAIQMPKMVKAMQDAEAM
jgi:hypothetical protein